MTHDDRELERATYRLAANLLRIMAGAGRIQDLDKQLEEMSGLAKKIGEQSWYHADNVMAEALQIRWPRLTDVTTEEDKEFNHEQRVKENIVQDALRVAAAKLLGQAPNSTFNRASSFEDSLRAYEEFRQERRQRQKKQA